MGKAKVWKYNKDQEAKKQQLHGTKDGSVKKNKKPKFKSTPTGKVALINSSKEQNKLSRKNLQKGFGNGNIQTNILPKKASKSNGNQLKQGSPNKKHSLSKAQNDSIAAQKEHKNVLHPKTKMHQSHDESLIKSDTIDFESASSSDMEDSFNDVQSDSDIAVPDILGQSLADDSDEDDKDFEEEDDDSNEEEDDDNSNEEEEEEEDDSNEEEYDDDSDEEMVEHRGVKMFKGLKSNIKKNDIDEEDQEDDDDDEDENKSDEDMGFGNEDDDDDEDDEDEEEENDNDRKQLQKKLGEADSSLEIDESDEIEDEDEDEDEDIDEDDDSTDEELGIEALLGKSIADDDDDEDFNEEDEDDEDDDISSEDEYISSKDEMNVIRKENAKKKTAEAPNKKGETQGLTTLEHLSKKEVELTKKMIAIQNIPSNKTEEELRKMFGQFGTIESCHLKYDSKEEISKSSKNKAFILYKTEKSALKAAKAMHGKMIGPNYLFVQNLYKYDQDIDRSKIIAIHNLKSTIDVNMIWSLFTQQCGPVKFIQLVHDEQTGLSKGSAVIYFETEDVARSAFKLNGYKFSGRSIKVEPYDGPIRDKGRIFGTGTWGKECLMYLVNRNKKRALLNQNDNKPLKKFKHSLETNVAYNVEKNVKKQKKQQAENKQSPTSSLGFQGQKVDLKNKKKKNKLDKKKKRMAEKLLAKSGKNLN